MAQPEQSQFILGVDIGGTKTAAALIDLAGQVHGPLQEPTCRSGPLEGVRQLTALLERVLRKTGRSLADVAAIGVGIPAVLAPETDEVLWAPNLAGWRNVDLRSPLAAAFGLPVAVEYDGHTATLAEWWLGEGRGCSSFVNLIVGTGIGGGMVLDGRLVRGVNRLAGAAGWFALTADAAHKGERERSLGFWEAQAAGPAIAIRAEAQAANAPESLLARMARRPLTAAALFQAAGAGDALAQALLDETADLLGLGIANIVSLLNPELVVLGGGVGSRCAPLLPRIRAVVERWAQPVSAASCRLAVSRLGGAAGLAGAAYAAMLRFGLPGANPASFPSRPNPNSGG